MNLRAALKKEADAGLVPNGRGNVQWRGVMLVPRTDIGASGKQVFGDGVILRLWRRQEQWRLPVLAPGVDVRTARKGGGNAVRVVVENRLN
jgi:hypothetical protein